MNLIPLKDKIVLKQIEVEEKSNSGIILPDGVKEKPKQATVLAVGAAVAELKAGDIVVYKSYGPDEIKVDDDEYLIAKEEDILAKIDAKPSKGDK